MDLNNPDYVPTVNLGYETHLPDPQSRSERHERYQHRAAVLVERQELSSAAHTLLNLSRLGVDLDTPLHEDLLLQKDLEIKSLQEENGQLKEKVMALT